MWMEGQHTDFDVDVHFGVPSGEPGYEALTRQNDLQRVIYNGDSNRLKSLPMY